MIEAAPAKVNLALHLRRRREDGYHDLETVFVFTEFGDTLHVRSGAGLSLAMTGPLAQAVGDGDNLVLRAARALAEAAGVPANAALTLDKHIPVAAGLGGGSADAAAALRLLNRFWKLEWPIERLLPIAASLGADVPACLVGRTVTGTGRGEVLTPVDLDIAGTPILLVNPRVAVPTGPVFSGWDRIDRGPLDPTAWRGARNDLAEPAIRLAPVIAEVLAALANTGACLVRMSGSGATCFALYASAAGRDSAARSLSEASPGWWTCPTSIV
ncbi:4-(cytidine 5'-diphospho)-2-C-methyl-D-erythritol kinase [Polymorphobacter megasporae]|uniref:4-(cytidine 5'-diphospho)-2-C-methyl-D-erythritol kinase n=1 Tax=Glacieibacterium megasporae TaxID=2835787 RepID=UPI001C1E0AB8|nr:4-(cytidine 5'-diphospho)-2-C-methyl-D-erythritol kinase [Polymorphobacter megasporae]UAJ09450.1 4-(cytidine 5'-diphospho)-2-C-methyl-D-erythritol kinase [Polymorphobacter megasporae]